MSGFGKAGFTLIEMMVAMVILVIMATVALPRFATFLPNRERSDFIARLNSVSQIALTGALTTNKPHRVVVDMQERTFTVERPTGGKDPAGNQEFESAMPPYASTRYQWPADTFDIRQFFINNKDEIGQTKKQKVWFFVVPEGMAQPVIINLTDSTIAGSSKDQEISLVLNPFSVQFQLYDHFTAPAA